MRQVVTLLCAAGAAACSPVDIDLLGPTASACDLGEVGAWVDITPPAVTPVDTDPGIVALALDPFDRSVLYAATYAQGLWRTADCGATWERTNTGINGPIIQGGIPMDLALDAVAPDTLYLAPRFTGNSLWWSTNAGIHWDNIIPSEVAMPLYDDEDADIAQLAVDPSAAHHLLATSVVGWVGFDGDSGVLEGRRVDGTWQWVAHAPAPGMGTQQYVAFLDERTWLVVSKYFELGDSAWITRDAGATFERVDAYEAAPGWQLYRSPNGTLYRSAMDGLLRSTDAGATWTDVFAGLELGGTAAIVGDGTTLYATSSANDGEAVSRLFTAPEVPGDRDWVAAEPPSTASGRRFLRDDVRDVLYTFDSTTEIRRRRLR